MKVTSAIKSKVMTLGNKLARMMDRTDAFKKALHIVLAGSLEVCVVGVTFENRQEALRRLAGYNPADVRAVIVPENDNPVDTNALAVMVGVQGGRGLYKLGYVPATQTSIVKALLGRLAAIQVLTGDIFGARLSVRV